MPVALQELDLSNNLIGDEGAEALAARLPPHLCVLRLEGITPPPGLIPATFSQLIVVVEIPSL